MEVKGTAVVPISKFVQSKFADRYDQWIQSLPGESAGIVKTALSGSWYPLKEGMIQPTRKVCELFYGGKEQGAYEIGKYSAEYGLKGIYSIFVKIGTPSFIISQGSKILPTYYKGSAMKVVEETKNTSVVHITDFDGIDRMIEMRIAGWMDGALSACGCKGVTVNVTRSKTKGDTVSEFICRWN